MKCIGHATPSLLGDAYNVQQRRREQLDRATTYRKLCLPVMLLIMAIFTIVVYSENETTSSKRACNRREMANFNNTGARFATRLATRVSG